ncbi:capsule biosynthesis protein CapB [Polyangium mundeleinium]|uniref:Capsule biosynthesis protein CapB n=1 Tax=Polyangium mundeleinium TaxID=2995306 RepID=A0ABT5F276_9BACT|nr:capsule biosynthesis protein CapB [Polyangium mundeleinium]MDC0748206.1 capsule biosynthesis protein CapB [Polyangium mundeleinium]
MRYPLAPALTKRKSRHADGREGLAIELFQSVSPLMAKLRAPTVERIAENIAAELGPGPHPPGIMIASLVRAADVAVGELDRLNGEAASLMVAYQGAATDEDKRKLLIDHLRASAKTRLDARRDVQATKRWLDMEAVQERFAARIADQVDAVEVAYEATITKAKSLTDGDAYRLLSGGGVLEFAMSHASTGRPQPVRVAALRVLAALLARLNPSQRLGRFGVERARQVLAWARGVDAMRWAQVAALEIASLVFPDGIRGVISERLRIRSGKDGPIIRRNSLRILGTLADDRSRLDTGLIAKDDPSEHVRQELARFLGQTRSEGGLEQLVKIITEDKSPRVRGLGIRVLTKRAGGFACEGPRAGNEPPIENGDPAAAEALLGVIQRAFTKPEDSLPVRVALESVKLVAAGTTPVLRPGYFVEPLATLANNEKAGAELTEGAAATLRWLEVAAEPELMALAQRFKDKLEKIKEGRSSRFHVPPNTPTRDLERALAVAARGDMTVSLQKLGPGKYILWRGEPRHWRFWRFWNELKTPMPDKRKGYAHTQGRVWQGEIVVPPYGMAEVTPTRVPGERQLCPPVAGWGPFLPRVDELLSVCSISGKPLRMITPVGTVLLRGPDTLKERMRARWKLSLEYPQLALVRQRSLGASEPREKKLFWQQAQELGFSLDVVDTEGEIENARFNLVPHLPRNFYAPLPFALPPIAEHVLSFLLSPSGNTPAHLAVVVWGLFSYLMLRTAVIMRGIEKARAAIPLSIGGWGTRGKSGSERLKAALFHAMRYDVVVKTTGCEAMFIHAMRDLPAGEIFIYRPYDKATIWEQRNVLFTGKNLHCQVFLWECMALQPRFVETLCNEWMQDPITTLTNAYPDHEDIQGPGGEDVARVISCFMPQDGVTFTSEEQMFPLFLDNARRKRTNLVHVQPIEADIIPVDLLQRLPYQEHPRNVALVLELADYFQIDREKALVEIADHVILDLGVLKTYPTVEYRGRKLTFSNGMSANERAGFLSNWTRLAYDKHNPDETPDRATCAVVNNRADRVARSRVFAQIFVDDAGCDHIVLINTNLGGMMQFITEALDSWLGGTRITADADKEKALVKFDEYLRRTGTRSSLEALEETLLIMLKALPMEDEDARKIVEDARPLFSATPEELGAAIEKALSGKSTPEGKDDIRPDIVAHTIRYAKRTKIRDDAKKRVSGALDQKAWAEADGIFRAAYRELFLERVYVLWNSGSTGDQVIDFMVKQIPPGMDVRIMGTQNIKGTGLDFVYRWLSMDRVRLNIEKMETTPSARAEVLTFFMSYNDFSLIDCREALEATKRAKTSDDPDWQQHANLINAALERLSNLERDKVTKLQATGKAGLGQRVLNKVEQLFDHLDSVRRTNTAQTVMNDLFAARVGHGQAAILLRDVTGRSKGGWLYKDLKKWWAKQEERFPWLKGKSEEEQKKDDKKGDSPPTGDPAPAG